jgi:polysaccharide pyruvyl transferase WcaK-like protein
MGSVLIVGDLGTRDPGTTSLLQALTTRVDGRRPVLTSSDPAATRARTGLDAIGSADGAGLWRAVRAADGVVLVDGALRGTRTPGRHARDLRTAALRLCLAARAIGKPVALFTVAADGLATPGARLRARTLVRCADLVVLRDRTSADALARAGAPTPLRVGADATWAALAPARLADAPDAGAPPRDELIAVMNAGQAARDTPLRLGTALGRVAADRGLSVRLVPWRLRGAGADDLDLARAVAAHIPGADVDVPPADLGQMRTLAVRAAVVLTGRLHALHAAASAGAPVLTLSARGEERLLAHDLGQATVHPAARPSTIADRLSAAIDGPPPHVAVVAGHEQAAERSLRLLRLLLARGASDDDLAGISLPLQPAPEVLR